MKKLVEEFKTFIARGNVMDLAVGVIIGSAFTGIVNSVVNDLIMPVISLVTGGISFTNWNVTLVQKTETRDPVTLNFGNFVSALLNFLIIAIIVFLIVKGLNKLSDLSKLHHKEEEAPVPTEKECPYCKTMVSIDATRCPHCTSFLDEKTKEELAVLS